MSRLLIGKCHSGSPTGKRCDCDGAHYSGQPPATVQPHGNLNRTATSTARSCSAVIKPTAMQGNESWHPTVFTASPAGGGGGARRTPDLECSLGPRLEPDGISSTRTLTPRWVDGLTDEVLRPPGPRRLSRDDADDAPLRRLVRDDVGGDQPLKEPREPGVARVERAERLEQVLGGPVAGVAEHMPLDARTQARCRAGQIAERVVVQHPQAV